MAVKELSEHPTVIDITVPLENGIGTFLFIGQPWPHTLRPYEINISSIKWVLRLHLRNTISLIKRKSKF
jgi:hypothetical protein